MAFSARQMLVLFFFLMCRPTCIVGGRGGPPSKGCSAITRLKNALGHQGGFSVSLNYMDKYGSHSYHKFLSGILEVSPITIFLPTDAAWNKTSPNLRKTLQRKSPVQEIFKYYTVRQMVNASTLNSLTKGAKLLSLEGSFLEKLGTTNGRVLLGWSSRNKTEQGQITCSDCYLTGIVAVHGVDTVLCPPDF